MADEILSAPVMHTIARGVIVQRPDGEAAPAQVGPFGGLSIGGAHLPSAGGVIHLAVHHPAGDTLMVTLGPVALRDLARRFNAAMTRLERGDFDQPEVAQ